jgi:hypothetical protein
MNQNIPDDSLDNMLYHWADERAAGSSHIDNLQDRISLAIKEGNARPGKPEQGESPKEVPEVRMSRPGQEPTVMLRPVWPLRAKLVNRLVEVTLLAAVAFVWTTHFLDGGRRQLELVAVEHVEIPEYAHLTDDVIRDRAIVLSEMKDVFGDQLNWLAETESRFEVGLSDGRLSNGSSHSRSDALEIAVRVVVEERSSPDNAWQRTWAADVISKNEEVVEFAAKNDDRTTMTMWAYVLPDGMVAIDSELDFSGGSQATPAADAAQFRAVFSNVQKDRQPSEELLTGANGVEYRVFQTVAVLNKKVG